MATDHRTLLERDLIRLLITYGKETLFVDVEPEADDAEEVQAEQPDTTAGRET